MEQGLVTTMANGARVKNVPAGAGCAKLSSSLEMFDRELPSSDGAMAK